MSNSLVTHLARKTAEAIAADLARHQPTICPMPFLDDWTRIIEVALKEQDSLRTGQLLQLAQTIERRMDEAREEAIKTSTTNDRDSELNYTHNRGRALAYEDDALLLRKSHDPNAPPPEYR